MRAHRPIVAIVPADYARPKTSRKFAGGDLSIRLISASTRQVVSERIAQIEQVERDDWIEWTSTDFSETKQHITIVLVECVGINQYRDWILEEFLIRSCTIVGNSCCVNHHGS